MVIDSKAAYFVLYFAKAALLTRGWFGGYFSKRAIQRFAGKASGPKVFLLSLLPRNVLACEHLQGFAPDVKVLVVPKEFVSQVQPSRVRRWTMELQDQSKITLAVNMSTYSTTLEKFRATNWPLRLDQRH